MAEDKKFGSKIMDFLGFTTDDDDDDEDGYLDEPEPAPQPVRRQAGRDRQPARDRQAAEPVEEIPQRQAAPAAARGGRQQGQSVPARQGSTAVPVAGGMKMVVYHPVSYDDTKNIIDNVRNRKPVVVNMEELEVESAQRILDMLGGAIYALDGTLSKVSRGIYIIAPNNYDIIGSGDEGINDDDY